MGWGTGNIGGGGASLNFKVVGGTTAPSNPKENTIWVATDVPITSWIFSAKEPSPTEAGMVWISVGSTSSVEFNALKKKSIQVYPISAKQYISGAWVGVTAMSYQNGEWVDWTNNLLSLYTWKAIGLTIGSGGTAHAPTATKNPDDSVTLVMPGSGFQQRGGYIIDELIDLTSAKSLKVKYNNMNYENYAEFGASILPSVYDNQKDAVTNTLLTTDESFPASGEIVVDVSALSGFYYIFLPTYATNSGRLSITVEEVTLV